MEFKDLEKELAGELYFDESSLHQTQLMAYATDASIYQEKPVAVALPLHTADVKVLVNFARQNRLTLIPRAAGTSLAGQVVGNGIVVDISKHFNQIIEIDANERWVKVQPGVIRDDLNQYLKPHGLMFGPETSTANRAMIGGMVGNNSCGLHSMVWGSVRDHLLEAKVVLSDGSEATFGGDDFTDNRDGSYETIKNNILGLLSEESNQEVIQRSFPKASVKRRNTGYALDSLLAMRPFNQEGKPFNLCALLAGSEGTLAFVTEVKLNLLPLPPKSIAMVCVHTTSVDEALRANLIALKFEPHASELVDKYICDFTIGHPEYGKHRHFIVGDPAAILMVEFMADDLLNARVKVDELIASLALAGIGYAYPVLLNEATTSAWDIRKAGLGLLRNLKGNAQPVNLIEDCAVAPEDLPAYIADLEKLLASHHTKASYYAHAGAGELHVEPIIDLKSAGGLQTFRELLTDTVQLVKKYNGSLSGEHGDGRLRGEFIPEMMGQQAYELFKQVKLIFDPDCVFNQGKVVATPPMDTHLRVKVGQPASNLETIFSFDETDGMLAMAEKCSGSGDCRKSAIAGGVMCPSYMATRQEKDTTRARANVLRQFLSNPHDGQPLDHPEIKDVLDLCISCKGCKTECPSGVDVAKMKAEFQQQYYDQHPAPLRAKLIANFSSQMKLASALPGLYNFLFNIPLIQKSINRLVGFHPSRSMPSLSSHTFSSWMSKRKSISSNRKVYLFCDEFTNYNDVEIGKQAVLLLEALGYEVIVPKHIESGRTHLSKGFLRKAKQIANQNIELLGNVVTKETPLIGIEPSAILTLRDEYKDLAEPQLKAKALRLAANTYTIEEFLANEFEQGNINSNLFNQEQKAVLIHGHCYQKSLSSQKYLQTVLSIPQNYSTTLIPSGCCGMAGSFGYEKEHFEISQQIGELVLFPAVRHAAADCIIAASGTSCRHQIKDGTGKKSMHPVEILYEALLEPKI
jgi:FAD/FMN-containing dehydrogenase/Fe-S oxidoreductase